MAEQLEIGVYIDNIKFANKAQYFNGCLRYLHIAVCYIDKTIQKNNTEQVPDDICVKEAILS